MNRALCGLSLTLLCVAVSCGVARSPEPRALAPQPQAARAAAAGQDNAPASRQLVRTADLSMAVDDTEAAAQQIHQLASSLDGYVSSFTGQRRDGVLFYSMTLRVPNDKLDAALESLKKLASSVDQESLSTEDVTDRVIDLGARLRTLTATEAELQALLAESRARNRGAEDIMAIYRELTEIRSKIEQLQGQLKDLQSRVALSAINLSLRPTQSARPVLGGRWQPVDTARSAARALVHVLRFLVDAAIFIVIVVLPVVALILGVPLLILRRLWRGRRKGTAPVTHDQKA